MPPRKGTKRAAPVEEPLIEEIDIDDEEEARDIMPSPKKAPAKGKGKAAKAKTPTPKAKAKAKTPKAVPAAKKSKRAAESDTEEAESETEYEVERILDMKVLKGVQTFEVKWKGFPNSRNTWEPAENLTQCGDLLDNFREKLEKNDVSRARRVSTVNSTKSSSTATRQPSATRNAATPATASRVTRSRSRTPSRNTHVPIASSTPQGKNRQSSVQRVMDEGLSKKLEKLKASRSKSEPKKREVGRPRASTDKNSSKPTPTKSQKSTASKQSGNGNVASLQPKSSGRGRRRMEDVEENIEGPSLFAKAAKYCGLGAAAVSAGLGALFYTNPQAVDWTYVGEQARILFENLHGGDVPGTAGTV